MRIGKIARFILVMFIGITLIAGCGKRDNGGLSTLPSTESGSSGKQVPNPGIIASEDPVDPGMDRPISINLIYPTVGMSSNRRPDMVVLPCIMDHQPTFRAKISSRDGVVSAKGIAAMANRRPIAFQFDELSGEWSWTPEEELPEGGLLVEIWAEDSLEYHSYNHWQLKIDSTPPQAKASFLGASKREIIVSFNEPVGLERAIDVGNWTVEEIENEDEPYERRSRLPVTSIEVLDSRQTQSCG